MILNSIFCRNLEFLNLKKNWKFEDFLWISGVFLVQCGVHGKFRYGGYLRKFDGGWATARHPVPLTCLLENRSRFSSSWFWWHVRSLRQILLEKQASLQIQDYRQRVESGVGWIIHFSHWWPFCAFGTQGTLFYSTLTLFNLLACFLYQLNNFLPTENNFFKKLCCVIFKQCVRI